MYEVNWLQGDVWREVWREVSRRTLTRTARERYFGTEHYMFTDTCGPIVVKNMGRYS